MHDFKIHFFKLMLLFIFQITDGALVYAGNQINDQEYKRINNSNLINIDNERNKFSCLVDQSITDKQNSINTTKNIRKELFGAVNERLVNSCIISFDEVKRRLSSNSVVLADIRPKEEYENYRISGSINIASHTIKSRSYLKKKHLVIVGSKVDLVDMALLCRELKVNGFKKVNIMQDAMEQWGNRLTGQNPQAIKPWVFGKIEPRDFSFLKTKMKWMVLDATGQKENTKKSSFVYRELDVVSFREDDVSSINKVKSFISSQQNNKLFGVLVISKQGNDYNKISSYLEKHKINNLYYMEGGLENYTKYLLDRNAFLARLKKGSVNTNSCGNGSS